MSENKSKYKTSSNLASIFFQIEMLKEDHPEAQHGAHKIEQGVHALAKELYELKQKGK